MLGLVFAALVMATVVVFEGRSWTNHFGVTEAEPVLVFVIPEIERARRVRAATQPDRIVWEGADGLALKGGRVVALDLDRAGDVIEQAGWIDRPIQIVRLDDPATSDEVGSEGGSDPERAARLRELINKPTLTRGEQIFVLSAMNDGLEI